MTATERLEPLTAATIVVVDMQRLFAEATEWQVPSLPAIVPQVHRLAARRPDATFFTRFVTPPSVEAASGRWRHYYERWRSVTLDRMAPAMLDLLPELAQVAQPGSICDKATFSAFKDGPLPERLRERDVRTLMLCGVETDVCVLATALEAVDMGYRVLVVEDAVTSWSLESHRAVLDFVLPRFDRQIEVATVDAALAAWQS